MAQTLPTIYRTNILTNLDTYNHTALANSIYTVNVQLTETPPSGMSITIKQNSSTMASISSPAASQSVMNLQVQLNCAINDTISVVLASSSAIDQQLNNIRAILEISQGTI